MILSIPILVAVEVEVSHVVSAHFILAQLTTAVCVNLCKQLDQLFIGFDAEGRIDLGIGYLNVFRNDRLFLICVVIFPVVQHEPGIFESFLLHFHGFSGKIVAGLLFGDYISDVFSEDHIDFIGLVEAHLVNQLLVGPHQVSVRITGKPNLFLKFQRFLLFISDFLLI